MCLTHEETAMIRVLRVRDLCEVVEIERTCYQTGAWDADDFRQHMSLGMGIVWDTGDAVRGFALCEVHEELYHIVNLAVDPAWHRQGIGSALVGSIQRKLTPDRRPTVATLVRLDNPGALQFLKHNGFKATLLLEHAYDGDGMDGVWMEYSLQPYAPCNRIGEYLP